MQRSYQLSVERRVVGPVDTPREGSRASPRDFVRPILTALTIALLDTIVLLIMVGSIPTTTLVLVLFLEGGMGLLIGAGISLSSTPSISHLGETLFGTAPWSKESEKHAEEVGLRWFAGSAILVGIGFLLSVL